MDPLLVELFLAGVAAVEPARCVRDHLERDDALLAGGIAFGPGRLLVVAFGKAAPAMTRGLVETSGRRVDDGVVVTHAAAEAPLPLVVAGHPLPDAGSVRGGREALRIAAAAGPADLLVVLVSGGGSSLLEVPAGALDLDDLVATNRALLRSGADIVEINAVRKHLSAVKGGRLAEAARRCRLLTLVLSDVVGDPLDVIASGPTVPDPTTYADALEVLERRRIAEEVPAAVVAHLRDGAAGRVPETPKEAHPRHVLRIVGNGAQAAEAVVAAARERGLIAEVVSTTLVGEAREVGPSAAAARVPGVDVLVWAGETTVTVRGDGRGGRNQEAALAAALAIEGTGTTFLAAGTDGIDGPTDAAGAVVDGGTVPRGSAAGLDAWDHLARNDAYPYLAATGDLLVTGPTGTNVADLWICRPG